MFINPILLTADSARGPICYALSPLSAGLSSSAPSSIVVPYIVTIGEPFEESAARRVTIGFVFLIVSFFLNRVCEFIDLFL
jgi:hypothetical protein